MEEAKKTFYANSLEVKMSSFDIIFSFVTMIPPSNGQEKVSEVRDSLDVIMSPQHAKAVFRALEEGLENYENIFGEIKLLSPEELEKKISK